MPILRTVITISFMFLLCQLAIAQKKTPSKPKLIIGIVVEQMRYDYLEKYKSRFTTDGFNRLQKSGTLCKNAQYNYTFNHDAVGYATIATGTNPSQHGIIANTWYNRLSNQQIYAVDDPTVRIVGATTNGGRFSPKNLMAGTLGDALKLASMGKSKVHGVAMKDCGAILSVGRSANAAYWLDDITGAWVTSTFYLKNEPKWVNNFNRKDNANRNLNKRWFPEYRLDSYKKSLPDVNDYEAGLLGYKKAFPYYFEDLRKQTNDYSLLKFSPYGNTLTRDFAQSLIINERLGKDNETDLLMIGFSSTGYLSQVFTPNSLETEDAFIKLDKEIAELLTFLDQQVGKENYLLFLTSNTGVPNSQGYLQEMRMKQGLFKYRTALPLLESYLKAIYKNRTNWIKHYEELQLYLDHSEILKAGHSVAEVQNIIAEFLVSFEGVANTYTAHSLQNTDFSSGMAQKVKNSYSQKRSADVLLTLEPGWVQQSETADHNSAYNYDTHVPLLWFGWKIEPKVITTSLHITDIAVTLATYLNIPKPNAATGKHIWELAD